MNAPGRTHASAAQIAADLFTEIRVSVALNDESQWYPIHNVPTVIRFEVAHGSELSRWAYNDDAIARVRRTRRTFLGEHAGFCDLFVPVRGTSGHCDVLVVGPFCRARPDSGEVLLRWQAIAASIGRVGDPEFLHFLTMTLGTLTLDGDKLQAFERFVSCFTALLEQRGNPDQLLQEIGRLRVTLSTCRRFERMGELVHELVDERSGTMPTDPPYTDYRNLGVRRLLRHALVGVLVGAADEADPVDGLIRRDGFQRACADLCVSRGGAISGPIADYGVVVVTDDAGGSARSRAALTDLAQRLRTLARRFRLRLHIGISPGDDRNGLPAHYQAALAAAESAISRGVATLELPVRPGAPVTPLREFGTDLARAITEDPKLLVPSFTRYLDAITAHCGYRLEPLRAHLEGAFETLADSLRRTGLTDERSVAELERDLRRAAVNAVTVRELLAAYREAIADIERALMHPSAARQDRSLRRAIAYIKGHLAGPLPLADVARVAGFAPTYFCTSFAKSEGVSFGNYVRRLRVERAKHMLTETELSIERVAQLSGFASRSRFHQTFRRVTQSSPAAYRRTTRPKKNR